MWRRSLGLGEGVKEKKVGFRRGVGGEEEVGFRRGVGREEGWGLEKGW